MTVENAGLSPRECDVVRTFLTTHPSTNKAIGRELSISPWTVAKHMEHIFDKIGVDTRYQLAAHFA